MRVEAICIYKSSMTGTKKDGTNFGMVKCLDDVNDNFCNLFCEKSVVDKIQKLGISRNQEIALIMNINIGYKNTYVSLIDVEKV